jgi:hypothetical protein
MLQREARVAQVKQRPQIPCGLRAVLNSLGLDSVGLRDGSVVLLRDFAEARLPCPRTAGRSVSASVWNARTNRQIAGGPLGNNP